MYKFNGGRGALVCDNCKVIIYEDVFRDKDGKLLSEGVRIDICPKCKKDCGHSKDFKGLQRDQTPEM